MRARRWWRFTVPLLAAAAAAVVLEGILRLADRETRTHNFLDFLVDDPVRGWALRPGFAALSVGEGTQWVSINGDGMRGPQYSIAKPAGTFRIAVLGDSFIQAANEPLDNIFTTQLERRLAASLRPLRVEVLNFGVNGYATTQEVLTFRHHARQYQPDVVLLAMYLQNDIYGNHPELNPSTLPGTPYLDTHGVIARPSDQPQLPWRAEFRVALTERSRVAGVIWGGWSALREWGGEPSAAVAPPLLLRDTEGFENEIYRPPSSSQTEESWRITERLLVMLSEEVRASGGELWIATLSMSEQTHPDPAVREAFAKKIGVEALYYPDRRVRAFADSVSIPVISLAEPLGDYAALHHVFLNGGYSAQYPLGTGHWNATGHAVAAEVVAGRLRAAYAGRIASP